MTAPFFRPAACLVATFACCAALAAQADAPTANEPAPSFAPSQTCDGVEGFDPQWHSHGDDFGLSPAKKSRKSRQAKDQKTAAPAFIWGFYQMQVRGDTLYAAFGGAARPGVTPGALLALDADSLALRRSIALPFAAHALAMNAQGNKAVATHTVANAFSIIDVPSGQVRCRKADTQIGDVPYRGRYVQLDETGHFYINYNSFGAGHAGRVMKYTPEGEHANGFAVLPTEQRAQGLVMPLLLADGQLYTGSASLIAVDATSGQPRTLVPAQAEPDNIYTYTPGPGGRLLAANYSPSGTPNLQLIDLQTQSRNGIFTGINTVEVAYAPEAGLAFAANYESKTLTIAALPAGAEGFAPDGFANVVLDGNPATLAVRHNAGGTDVYVAAKNWDEGGTTINASKGALLHKIHIDARVKHIDDLQASGACTVTVLDMRTRRTTAPRPCQLLDAQASRQAARIDMQNFAQKMQTTLGGVQAGIAKARADVWRAEQTAQAQPNAETRQAEQKARQHLNEQQGLVQFLQQAIASAQQGQQRLAQP